MFPNYLAVFQTGVPYFAFAVAAVLAIVWWEHKNPPDDPMPA